FRSVPADILAIRSAACEDANRTARVSARAVASFRDAMRERGDSIEFRIQESEFRMLASDS
ncbi:MAG: hypothetical protein AABP62_26040, partial [Planctomycetota bacterium]